jgi:2-keto-4-pentenoate hydratase/2-oxohepta-3-ene-1,7-dioic acid hydratase in catechol pathway
MRLATYRDADGVHGAVAVGEALVDIDAIAAAAGLAPSAVPGGWTARAVLELSPEDRDRLAAAAVAAAPDATARLADVELLPPLTDPDKVVCVGLNYVDHAAEITLAVPERPILFAKYRTSLVGHGARVVVPPITEQPDYEAELAIVIGRTCRDVPRSDALSCIAGVMPFNDVSARDLQTATSQWMPGKALDTFAPCGPVLVLVDEIDDLLDLTVVGRLNGEVVQQASTADMLFPIDELVSFVSSIMTLVPGDIIATGTPPGVGWGRTPPQYLQDGDEFSVEIGGVATLTNTIVRTPAAPDRPLAVASEGLGL